LIGLKHARPKISSRRSPAPSGASLSVPSSAYLFVQETPNSAYLFPTALYPQILSLAACVFYSSHPVAPFIVGIPYHPSPGDNVAYAPQVPAHVAGLACASCLQIPTQARNKGHQIPPQTQRLKIPRTGAFSYSALIRTTLALQN